MTVVVLAVLAIVWIVVLGSYARERFGGRTHDSVSAFHSQLSTLQRTQPGSRPSQTVRSFDDRAGMRIRVGHEAARIRRRNILFGLVGAVATTGLLAIVAPSTALIGFNLITDLALVAYVALLVNQQRIVAEQRTKVRRIHPANPGSPASRPARAGELRPGLAAVARPR